MNDGYLVLLVVAAAIGIALLVLRNRDAPDWEGTVRPTGISSIPGDFDFAAAAGTAGLASGPKILTRTYRGKLEQATRAFQADASVLASSGYRPVAQNYVPGSYSCAAFLVALILCILLVGILIFIYMIVVKPPGSLVVTYQRD